MEHPLLAGVRAAAVRLGLFEAGAVVVGVSGGADSMALLYALANLRRATGRGLDRLVVAHLNHRMRGRDSDEDARFVAAAADRLALELVLAEVDVPAEAERRRQNLEAVARDLRYAFLAETAEARSIALVAVAHTADDQAETLLMRLARGAGVDGLAGIAPRRPLERGADLVRPLLEATRSEVLDYCRALEIEFRTDASNFDLDQTRAFVRHELLPRLERIAPGAAGNLARTARLAREDAAFFATEVDRLIRSWTVLEAPGSLVLPVPAIAALPEALGRRVLREAIRRVKGDLRRIDARHLEAVEALVRSGSDGGAVDLPDAVRVRRSGEDLRIALAGRNCVEMVDRRS